MLLKGISLDNKIIKKAIFRLYGGDTLLDITFIDNDDCEIINMGSALQELREVDRLRDGLINQGIVVNWALTITCDDESMTATMDCYENKDYSFNDF